MADRGYVTAMTREHSHTLDPAEAVDLYLEEKKADDVSARTIQTYRAELRHFIQWCEDESIDAISDVDGMAFKRYKLHLAENLAPTTVSNRLRTAHAVLRWAASIGATDANIVNQIEVKRRNDVRSGEVTADEAEAILARLRNFRYASMDHVLFELLWHTGIRVGTIRSFDVGDFASDPDESGPYLRTVHRPETDTPLKNGENAERLISLTEPVAIVLEDYLDVERSPVHDDYGREPLMATRNGRPSIPTFRTTLHALTRPCWYGDECPVDRDPENCEAAQTKRDARTCPESNSPHDVRRGRITHYRREGAPKAVVSDRCDVSEQILKKHYNEMTDGEKMEQRREYLQNL